MTEQQTRVRIADLERYVRELTFWEPDSENFKRIRDEARAFLNSPDGTVVNGSSADGPRS